jgi:hydroxymethylpyrimidine pyrophosphatase-like HAD family hydrolase
VLETVQHFSHAVFAGGAMVIDTGKEVTLHRTAVEPDLARDVCRVLEEAGHAVLALQDTGAAGVDYLVSDEVPLNAETIHWMNVTRATVRHVSRLSSYPHEHTIRLGIVAPVDEVARVNDELAGRFGERIFFHRIYVQSAGVEVLEIFDPAVNKWEGILHVARHHAVDPGQIVAIGDDVNDVPMLTRAGLGVAMGNARPEIQAVAKRVIGSNRDEGLAAFLEELLAQHVVEPIDNGGGESNSDPHAGGEEAAA